MTLEAMCSVVLRLYVAGQGPGSVLSGLQLRPELPGTP